ncbi:YidH family protein [Bacillus songklensis]|uniref:YidH family protein n=1 Tax=Bacillus songklensis TaxID=1069116 RepID=A0ABV8B9W1_9BACI
MSKESLHKHLANERTFLSWVRTAIAIVGIGFLITNLHVKSSVSWLSDATVLTIGILAVVTGVLTIVMSVISYFKKINQINEQTFRSSKMMVLCLAVMMILIISIFGFYFLTL